MLELKNITPLLLQKYGLLPTRISIGEGGPSSIGLNSSIPYYSEFVSMMESPQITDYIRQAIEQVYDGANCQSKL